MASVAAAGSASALAAETGKPVRETPLEPTYWGTLYYDDKERSEVTEVIETGRPFRWYGPGAQPPNKVATFEKEYAARMQTKYALAVTSGTTALQSAMAAFRIGPGDEVILPAWTWHSCSSAVVLAGGLPVFAEIDDTLNIDPTDIEKRITKNTKLIMAVHLLGGLADLDPILEIGRKHNIPVLEDAAQCVGGSYKGRPLGSLGAMGIYSHQLNKTITAGEGGSVVTSDVVLFERAARFHDLGGLRPLHEQVVGKAAMDWFVGCNCRMSELTGGVMLAQLRKLDRVVGDAQAAARRVVAGIQNLPGLKMRKMPDPKGDIGAWVFLKFDTPEQSKRFMALMKAENVPATRPGGSVVLPTLPYIENKATVNPNWPTWNSPRGKAIQYGAASCPRTLAILQRFAGVGIDPKYTKRDTDDIVAAIRKVWPAVTKA